MPMAAPSYCSVPHCTNLVEGGGACKDHRVPEQRPTAHQRGYTKAWAKARLAFLRENPLCKHCLEKGRVTPARVVDHIVDHKGDVKLFWDKANWQSLCDWTSEWNCHGSKTGRDAAQLGRPT